MSNYIVGILFFVLLVFLVNCRRLTTGVLQEPIRFKHHSLSRIPELKGDFYVGDTIQLSYYRSSGYRPWGDTVLAKVDRMKWLEFIAYEKMPIPEHYHKFDRIPYHIKEENRPHVFSYYLKRKGTYVITIKERLKDSIVQQSTRQIHVKKRP